MTSGDWAVVEGWGSSCADTIYYDLLVFEPTTYDTLLLCYQDVIVGIDKYNYSLKTASQYCQHHSVISATTDVLICYPLSLLTEQKQGF